MDLVIQNGTIVTATETYQADIGIDKGVIALIGQPPLFPPQSGALSLSKGWGGGKGGEVIDATGKYVLPGGVDVHVHLQMTIGEITSSDDFTTGTIAAACGGTTTVIDFIDPQPGQSLHQAVAERRSQADGCVAIDYGLHLTATNARPETLAEIKELASAGYTSLKLYTTYPALMVDDGQILDLMAVAATCGVLPIVHTENHWIIEYLKQKLLAEGKTEPRYHPRSRPPLAEAEAVNRVLALAQLTKCPVYLAHLTCRESLEVVRRYQAQGQRVYAEVCPQHLILSEDEYERPGFEAAKFVLSPPLRDKSNWEPLWHGLATGTLHVISTDHCPWNFATDKQRSRNDFTQIPNGAPGIETRVPLIYHFGVNEGRLSINKFVELVSTAPARLFGLWPRKGTIAVGSDADIVIFDPHKERTLTKETLHMNVDYSPYEHIMIRGYPVMTIARGKVIVKDDEFVGQVGAGQFLERQPFSKEQRSKEQRSKEVILCSPAPLRPCSSAPLLLTWAEIDLDAIAYNARGLKRLVGEKTELMAVVKANGYGHGAVPVAEAVLGNGASSLAVHRTLEGVQLRQAGIAAPVLIMGYTLPAEAETIVRWDLTPTVNTLEQARALSAAASHPPFIPPKACPEQGRRVGGERGGALPIHVKVDTGLGRFGLLPEEVVDFVQAISELPGLILEGIYTHFAVADAADKAYTLQQFEIYLEVVKRLEEAGFTVPIKHVASSAATLDLPETHLDMVRCGIALYGLRPSSEVEPSISLRPALSLKSRVARVRTLPTGSPISYGCTYTTKEPTLVALVPVGYGDGYRRRLSNRGQVLIHGQRAPIVGRVCMDQFVVKVSNIPNVQQDDEVVLLGRQGDDEISAEEVATWAETINYEVTTSIVPRVTRVYLKGGQVVAVHPLVEAIQQFTF